MKGRKNLLHSIRADYNKATIDLESLQGEVIKAIHGESAFSQTLLGSLITEAKTKCTKLQKLLEDTQAAYDEGQSML